MADDNNIVISVQFKVDGTLDTQNASAAGKAAVDAFAKAVAATEIPGPKIAAQPTTAGGPQSAAGGGGAQLDAARKAADEFGKSAEMGAEKAKRAFDAVKVSFEGVVGLMTAGGGIGQASQAMGALAETTGGVASALGLVKAGAGLFIAGELVRGVTEAAKRFYDFETTAAQTAIGLKELQDTAGASATSIVALGRKMASAGIDADSLQIALRNVAIQQQALGGNIAMAVAEEATQTERANLRIVSSERAVLDARMQVRRASEGADQARIKAAVVAATEGESQELIKQGSQLNVDRARFATGTAEEQLARALIGLRHAPEEEAFANIKGPQTVEGAELGERGAVLSNIRAKQRYEQYTTGRKPSDEDLKEQQDKDEKLKADIADYNKRQAEQRVKEAKLGEEERQEQQQAGLGPQRQAERAVQGAQLGVRGAQQAQEGAELGEEQRSIAEGAGAGPGGLGHLPVQQEISKAADEAEGAQRQYAAAIDAVKQASLEAGVATRARGNLPYSQPGAVAAQIVSGKGDLDLTKVDAGTMRQAIFAVAGQNYSQQGALGPLLALSKLSENADFGTTAAAARFTIGRVGGLTPERLASFLKDVGGEQGLQRVLQTKPEDLDVVGRRELGLVSPESLDTARRIRGYGAELQDFSRVSAAAQGLRPGREGETREFTTAQEGLTETAYSGLNAADDGLRKVATASGEVVTAFKDLVTAAHAPMGVHTTSAYEAAATTGPEGAPLRAAQAQQNQAQKALDEYLKGGGIRTDPQAQTLQMNLDAAKKATAGQEQSLTLSVAEALRQNTAAIKENTAALSNKGEGDKTTQKKASGGLITGPGSGTSDSVHIAASPGEYMLKAERVAQIGQRPLDDLNEGRISLAMGGLLGLPGFADGGEVDDPSERARLQARYDRTADRIRANYRENLDVGLLNAPATPMTRGEPSTEERTQAARSHLQFVRTGEAHNANEARRLGIDVDNYKPERTAVAVGEARSAEEARRMGIIPPQPKKPKPTRLPSDSADYVLGTVTRSQWLSMISGHDPIHAQPPPEQEEIRPGLETMFDSLPASVDQQRRHHRRRRHRRDDDWDLGFASGGLIPIRASNGEYRFGRDAVQRYGVGFFDMLNSGKRFATGGLVGGGEGSLPSFGGGWGAGASIMSAISAYGGSSRLTGTDFARAAFTMTGIPTGEKFVGGAGAPANYFSSAATSTPVPQGAQQLHSLNLVTNAGEFSVQASADQLEAISQSALGHQLISAGTRPSWYE